LCSGNTITLFAGSISGASYSWTGPNGFSSTLQSPTITNAGVNASGDYSVSVTVNGCTGPVETTSVLVNPIPSLPAVSSNSPICQGSGLNLTASSVTGASYSWIGPNGFSSSLQNPFIANTTTAASGTYSVTTTVNGCTSAAVNTAVTINAIPASPIIGSNGPLCENSTLSLTASNISGASYSWNGPNGFSSSLQNPAITNITAANSGNYSVTATANGCSSLSASQNVVVNIVPSSPTASSNSPVCSGKSISLNASTISGAAYNWSGPNGFTSNQQNPVIANASFSNAGVYKVSVMVNGCSSISSAIIPVSVNQAPTTPIVNNNGPVCEGSTLSLTASNIVGATYTWSGPNGFTSTSQNNSLANITAANKGTYYVTATANGCASNVASMSVIIDQPAMANAGNDQLICASNSFARITGTISGGKGSGIWSSNGSGTFSPNNTNLITSYYPSTADKTGGSVTLTLASTNNGACPASSSSVKIAFAAAPSANAGVDQTVCANNASAALNGQFNNAAGGVWSTSGTGSFSPSNTNLNAIYIPGASDKTNGSVKLTFTTTGNGPCAATSDAMILTIKTPPVINGDGVKYVMEESSSVLNTVVIGSNLKYSWTPGIYLNNDTIANPICTPSKDVLYKLIVKDALGCTSTGDIMVKILKHPEIPNVFTPNGDGTNDRWQIKYLADYPDCTVDIYNRYGQLIYRSVGYTNAWDGTSKGKQLPAGTYYYIIDPKNNLKPLSGFVDIVK
jgi:gliding motility-associated-like protein